MTSREIEIQANPDAIQEEIAGSNRILALGVAAVVVGAGILTGDIGLNHNAHLGSLLELLGETSVLGGIAIAVSEKLKIRRLRSLLPARQEE